MLEALNGIGPGLFGAPLTMLHTGHCTHREGMDDGRTDTSTRQKFILYTTILGKTRLHFMLIFSYIAYW
jgi:hypothetical protein